MVCLELSIWNQILLYIMWYHEISNLLVQLSAPSTNEKEENVGFDKNDDNLPLFVWMFITIFFCYYFLHQNRRSMKQSRREKAEVTELMCKKMRM